MGLKSVDDFQQLVVGWAGPGVRLVLEEGGPMLTTRVDSFVFRISRNSKMCETGHCFAKFRSFCETCFVCFSRKYEIRNRKLSTLVLSRYFLRPTKQLFERKDPIFFRFPLTIDQS